MEMADEQNWEIELKAEGGNFFRMSAFHLFADRSGGHCRLEVQADDLFLSCPFWFDTQPVEQCAEDVKKIQDELVGSAWIGTEFEPSRITLVAERRGHICVVGKLYVGQNQQAEFSFDSDQSYIEPFLSQLASFSRVLHNR